MKDLNKIIKNKLTTLLETKGFEEMESAFGVGKELSGKEKEQFDPIEELGVEKKGSVMPAVNHPGLDTVKKTRKEAGKEAMEYYTDTMKKMKKFQKPDSNKVEQSRIGESENKYNIEGSEREMYYGTGMEGLRYDSDGTERQEEFDERNENEDPTVVDLKVNGEKYKKYKYGTEKYKKAEDEYQETPRVRTTVKESDVDFNTVKMENIFKVKNELVSEEQVLSLINKIPKRVKVDETVFSITDGTNTYRLLWEGDETGEPVITNYMNTNVVSESINKMKHLWDFNSKDKISKSNITENSDDIFKKMFRQMKNTDGLIGE